MDVDGACRGLRQRPVCREPSRPVRSGEPSLGWAAAVPLVSDTAYPRLEPAPSPAEVVRFTPTLAEIAFVHRRTRQPGPRLALLVLLKTFQRLGSAWCTDRLAGAEELSGVGERPLFCPWMPIVPFKLN